MRNIWNISLFGIFSESVYARINTNKCKVQIAKHRLEKLLKLEAITTIEKRSV